LNADTTSKLRRACFKAGIKLEVVKNTLFVKAMEASENDYGDCLSLTVIVLYLFQILQMHQVDN
jgi:large subunit ribosomal protein L10